MKFFTLIVFLTLFGCSNKTDQNIEWIKQVDLSGTEFIFDHKIKNNSILDSDFVEFKLPIINCPVEDIDFQPKLRIYNKYLTSGTVDFKQILDRLSSYLQKKSKILNATMSPDDYGQLFAFLIQRENRYVYNYHLIDVANSYYLIETISTLGTKRKLEEVFKKIIEQIKPMKN